MTEQRMPGEERLAKTFREICAEAKARISETTPAEVQARIEEEGRDWRLIDVREQDEYRGGHLPAAGGAFWSTTSPRSSRTRRRRSSFIAGAGSAPPWRRTACGRWAIPTSTR